MPDLAPASGWRAALLLCAAQAAAAVHAADLVFAPAPGIRTEVTRTRTETGQALTVTVHGRGGAAATSHTIDIDSEKPLDIAAEDLDFDGHHDLWISHIDDGKGVHRLHEIYLYSPRRQGFVRAQPSCGDGFVNMTVERRQRRLRNAYFTHDGWRSCTMRLRQGTNTR